jgi:hypothetical protein
MERLAQAIQQSEPFIGYKLELKPTRHIDKSKIERLTEQKARLEYNLAYLQSISQPRPLLMRFTQEQLPALAAEIRSFPIHVILDGSIKYGFQATEQEPGGFHFLLIDPAETARLEVDPFPLWQDINSPHMRFRLDPFWASHYFDAEALNEAMVFVPEGCTIYPPLHSWEPRSMDRYLRETLGHWFQDRLKGITIPIRPIYLFDGEPVPASPITISVLDRGRMEPLNTRLGWLNDNLVIRRAIDKEESLRELAHDIAWQEMAGKIKADLEKDRSNFEETALTAARHVANTTYEMTGIFTTEINRIVRDTFRMAEKIKRTDQRLKEWDEVCADMEEMLKEVNRQRKNTVHKKNEALNEFMKLERDIKRELAVADNRRKEMVEQLEEEIKKMRLASTLLKKRLRSIKL